MKQKKRATRPRSAGDQRIPVIDLFAGPGGLGEGFSAPPEVGGTGRFRIALSIEKDTVAHQTLELRAFFRQFEHGAVPEEYYRFMRGELSRAELFNTARLTDAVTAARQEAWCAELGKTDRAQVNKRVRDAIKGSADSVLIGGPPCQAYSLVGRSRNRGNPLYDPAKDARHTLYREYLEVLAAQLPAVFVMENVKGLLSARLDQGLIFDRILADLHDPVSAVYGSHTKRTKPKYTIVPLVADTSDAPTLGVSFVGASQFIVRCEEHGIPQARHRVILLGVRETPHLRPPGNLHRSKAYRVRDVLDGLPKLRSGLSDSPDSAQDWHRALAGSLQAGWFRRLQLRQFDVAEQMVGALEEAVSAPMERGRPFMACSAGTTAYPEWYRDDQLRGVVNHETRTHMHADLHRYLFAAAFASVHRRSPVLGDFPPQLRPHHRNVMQGVEGKMFADRFRVQLADRPSTTITSHISKDGHYYIHYDPAQCRSLTAREAARLQTFPDNYFFCGGRTSQYHQIGNAVPPLLAKQIADIVSAVLR